MSVRQIRFDEVEAMRALVSEEYGPFGPEIEITQGMIDAFADLTGDRQWIHVDVERAKRESPFGGPIAHGMLTLSLLGKMRPPAPFELVGHDNVTNYGSEGCRFLAPVPAGARLHARMRLVGAQSKPTGTLLTSEVAVHVVGRDKPSVIYKALVLYQSRRAST